MQKILPCLLLVVLGCGCVALAQEVQRTREPQQPRPSTSPATNVEVARIPASVARNEDDRYRIGPGDVLKCRLRMPEMHSEG